MRRPSSKERARLERMLRRKAVREKARSVPQGPSQAAQSTDFTPEEISMILSHLHAKKWKGDLLSVDFLCSDATVEQNLARKIQAVEKRHLKEIFARERAEAKARREANGQERK
jgi:hypothetical protein